MKRAAWLLLPALAAGCEQPTPKVSKAEAEQLGIAAEQFRAENPGLTVGCFNAMKSAKGPIVPTPQDGCFKMQPAKRWRGLWNSGWEWTNFCPEPAKECPIASEHGDIWLEFAAAAQPKSEVKDGLYRIEFIGRRTVLPGHFGHLDQYDHTMIVDRLIAIQPVQAPWPTHSRTRPN